jgi:hypothetical protein
VDNTSAQKPEQENQEGISQKSEKSQMEEIKKEVQNP